MSRLQRQGKAPQSEHVISTLAEGLIRAFSPLLNGRRTSPFPYAILKIAERKQDFNFCKRVIAVARSPELNLLELITLCTLKIIRECVFLCFYIIAPFVQKLHLRRVRAYYI